MFSLLSKLLNSSGRFFIAEIKGYQARQWVRRAPAGEMARGGLRERAPPGLTPLHMAWSGYNPSWYVSIKIVVASWTSVYRLSTWRTCVSAGETDRGKVLKNLINLIHKTFIHQHIIRWKWFYHFFKLKQDSSLIVVSPFDMINTTCNKEGRQKNEQRETIIGTITPSYDSVIKRSNHTLAVSNKLIGSSSRVGLSCIATLPSANSCFLFQHHKHLKRSKNSLGFYKIS